MKNYMMDTLLSCHLPVITNRLEFFPQTISSPPIITSRIDFAKRLATTDELMVATEDSISTDGGTMDININEAFVAPASLPPDVSSNSGAEETTDLFDDAVDKKILKPRGQAGHPGSGGYSLDFVLRKWGSTVISSVNVSD